MTADSHESGHVLNAKAIAAFRLAMIDVVRKARETGTPVIVWRDGKVVELSPDELELPPELPPAEDPPAE